MPGITKFRELPQINSPCSHGLQNLIGGAPGGPSHSPFPHPFLKPASLGHVLFPLCRLLVTSYSLCLKFFSSRKVWGGECRDWHSLGSLSIAPTYLPEGNGAWEQRHWVWGGPDAMEEPGQRHPGRTPPTHTHTRKVSLGHTHVSSQEPRCWWARVGDMEPLPIALALLSTANPSGILVMKSCAPTCPNSTLSSDGRTLSVSCCQGSECNRSSAVGLAGGHNILWASASVSLLWVLLRAAW